MTVCDCGQSTTCDGCGHRLTNEWQVLAGDELAALNRAKTKRRYLAGQALFVQGDPNTGVYCVDTGTVGIRQLDASGNTVLLGLAYPGDVLGYRSLLEGRAHKTSAEALGPCTACKLDRRAVLHLLERQPALGLAFLRRSTREVEKAHEALFRTAVLSNRQKLLHLLAGLAGQHGRASDDGTHALDLPVSRRDLASMIGTRHETLSRIMGRLEDEGLARFSGRRVQIPSLAALMASVAAMD